MKRKSVRAALKARLAAPCGELRDAARPTWNDIRVTLHGREYVGIQGIDLGAAPSESRVTVVSSRRGTYTVEASLSLRRWQWGALLAELRKRGIIPRKPKRGQNLRGRARRRVRSGRGL